MKRPFLERLLPAVFAAVPVVGFPASSDNGLVSVSSDSPRVAKIVLVGDDFVVATKTPLRQGETVLLQIEGVGDYEVTSAKRIPLGRNAPAQYKATNRGTHEDPVSGVIHTICIDIKEDRIAVPWDNTTATLHLTEESAYGDFDESGDKDCPKWDVIWSCETIPGLSGSGRECQLPSNIPVGRHIIKAAFSEKPEIYDICTQDVIRVKIAEADKNVSGCPKCLDGYEFNLVDSWSPAGVAWSVISSGEATTSPSISGNGNSAVLSGGSGSFEGFLRAESLDIVNCYDDATLTVFYPGVFWMESWHPENVILDDDGYRDFYSPTLHSKKYIRFFLTTVPSSSWNEDANNGDGAYEGPIAHFCVIQRMKGFEKDANGFCNVNILIYGRPQMIENFNLTEWWIDSRNPNPFSDLYTYPDNDQPSGTFWTHDTPDLGNPYYEGKEAFFQFKTGVFCREQIPADLPYNAPIPATPFAGYDLAWEYHTKCVKNASGDLELIHPHDNASP